MKHAEEPICNVLASPYDPGATDMIAAFFTAEAVT